MTILLYDLVGADPARPFSPHCWKVAMALAHKGLAFERVPTPFTAVPAVEGGVSKTVPVIRDGEQGDRRIPSPSRNIWKRPIRIVRACSAARAAMAMARFVERWSQLTIHTQMMGAIVLDIHGCLAPEDQAYFRAPREARLGRTLEAVVAGRETRARSRFPPRWSRCAAC